MEYWTIETVPVGEEGNPVRPGINGGMMKKESPQQTPVNYITVESAKEYTEKVEKLGGTILVPPEKIPNVRWVAVALDRL